MDNFVSVWLGHGAQIFVTYHSGYFCGGAFWMRLTFKLLDHINIMWSNNLISIMWVGLIQSVEDLNKADPSLHEREFSCLTTSKLGCWFFLVLQQPTGLQTQTGTLALQILDLPASIIPWASCQVLVINLFIHPSIQLSIHLSYPFCFFGNSWILYHSVYCWLTPHYNGSSMKEEFFLTAILSLLFRMALHNYANNYLLKVTWWGINDSFTCFVGGTKGGQTCQLQKIASTWVDAEIVSQQYEK